MVVSMVFGYESIGFRQSNRHDTELLTLHGTGSRNRQGAVVAARGRHERRTGRQAAPMWLDRAGRGSQLVCSRSSWVSSLVAPVVWIVSLSRQIVRVWQRLEARPAVVAWVQDIAVVYPVIAAQHGAAIIAAHELRLADL